MVAAPHTWHYDDAFAHAFPRRIEQLRNWSSLTAIVEAMLKSKAPIRLRKPEPRDDDPTITRFAFTLQGPPAIVDAFFNGPCGYRAMHLGPDQDANSSVDRPVLDAIIERHRQTILQTPSALASFQSPHAKVWIKQDTRVTKALRGESESLIEIAVPAWVGRLDESVMKRDRHRDSQSRRYLARAGVLATCGRGVIEVKGGWVKADGQAASDPKDGTRSRQIREYGFT
jgi:hypothetical protein